MLKVCEKKEVRKDLTVDEFRRSLLRSETLSTLGPSVPLSGKTCDLPANRLSL